MQKERGAYHEDIELYKYAPPPGMHNHRQIKYFDIFGTFDIETTTYFREEEKLASMYVWQFCFNGNVWYGRSWGEFFQLIEKIKTTYNTSLTRRFVIYVHNLSYEFSWFCHHFNWGEVFAREEGEPIRACTADGIEFRCSYILSGKSLAALAEDRNYKIQKAQGKLDYSALHFWWTPLTNDELEYCYNDVLVVEEFIKDEIKRNGSIAAIPYTRTSYVRQRMRDACYAPKYRKRTEALMAELTIKDKEEYDMLRRAFQGGFTHANANRVARVYEQVGSYDITSSYPTVMVAEKYPMSKAEEVELTLENMDDLAIDHCLIFDVTFYNIKSSTEIDDPISESKCRNFATRLVNGKERKSAIINNGRIDQADRITMTITEVDFEIYRHYYTWDKVEFGKCLAYIKAPLPIPIVECTMDMYSDKTQLKEVEGKEDDYLKAKGDFNSTYGMMVTNIIQDTITFDGKWKTRKARVEDELERYNSARRRFLFYPWGIYVTAYARRNLLLTIRKIGTDYIYSDTDSIKFLSHEKHRNIFEQYNKNIKNKIKYRLQCAGIDLDKAAPKDVRGKKHPLGVWDFEGVYEQFKTLGAKRYLIYQTVSEKYAENNPEMCRRINGKDVAIKVTVAGAHKKKTATYLNCQKDPMAFFDDDMEIPEEYSGRLAALYIDHPTEDTVTDYLGQEGHWEERSSVALYPTQYHLNFSKQFAEFLKWIDLGLDNL